MATKKIDISVVEGRSIDGNEICAICHEDINSEQTFRIPVCDHVLHSNCLLQWFMTGNLRCPYCNSACSDNPHLRHKQFKVRYKIISSYCRRKNAHPDVVKRVKKIRELELKSKTVGNEIKKVKSETGEYRALKKKINSLLNQRWDIQKRIRDKKNELLYSVNILPFFISKKTK